MRTCGAAIAGGQSRRYGSPKAFARVGGRTLIERVLEALRAASDEQVISANDAHAYAQLGPPVRGDALRDAGAVAGIHAALLHAREHACSGILALACDMPFPSPVLLRTLVDHARATGAQVCAPASDGPRGLEPMCAYYDVACIGPIEQAVARGDLRVIGFHSEVRVAVLGAENVARCGDPERMFMNVNTPEDHARAQVLAGGDA